jgi:hypothetical protein
MALTRRQTLSIAAAWAVSPAGAAAAEPAPGPVISSAPDPTSANPLAARATIHTVVTHDLAASTRFYRDVIGYHPLTAGKLGKGTPSLPGLAQQQAYMLLAPDSDGPIVRLLLASPAAAANRPRGVAQVTEPGLAAVMAHPPDWEGAYRNLALHGVQAVALPQYYFFGGPPLPTSAFMGFSAFGPGGEQVIFTSPQIGPDAHLGNGRNGAVGGLTDAVLMTRDRWPLLRYYRGLIGAQSVGDIHVMQDTMNTLIGAPMGTYFWTGALGGDPSGGLGVQWWEYRQWKPATEPMWPTSLAKTGLAMTTLKVDNLQAVRVHMREHNLTPLAEGVLPSAIGQVEQAIYLRGMEGELIEVVARG